MYDDKDFNELEVDASVLRIGDGPIRVRVDMGYSKEVKGTGIWVKPSLSLEVPVPDDEDVNEYINKVVSYLSPKLKEIETNILRLNGFNPKVK